jgi:hypothetical protein
MLPAFTDRVSLFAVSLCIHTILAFRWICWTVKPRSGENAY